MKLLWYWFRRLLSGKPHFYIGGEKNPYLLRWFLIPRNPWFNVYLHKFMRDDEDRALHDHPWSFLSIMLWGMYWEFTPESSFPEMRSAPSFAYRKATHIHRVALARDQNGKIKPCWTLVITGRKLRTWGFWCPKGFVEWTKFVDQSDHGNVGKGCDQ
jgi:hypothetical protein